MKIDLSKISIDGDIQPREELDGETVTEYAGRMEDGDTFPPMHVMHDGSSYWLVDGYHRYAAYSRLGIGSVHVEVKTGTKRDAILAAVECNATHGKRRTNADKRRAVTRLLEDEEWVQWSDREIARRCGVSHQFVNNMRDSICQPLTDSQPRKVERGGTVYTQNTTNIGKAKPVEDEYEEVVVDEDTGEVIENASVMRTTKKPLKHGGPSQAVSDATHFAGIAISQLERIRDDDPQKRDALVAVQDWIKNHL